MTYQQVRRKSLLYGAEGSNQVLISSLEILRLIQSFLRFLACNASSFVEKIYPETRLPGGNTPVGIVHLRYEMLVHLWIPVPP